MRIYCVICGIDKWATHIFIYIHDFAFSSIITLSYHTFYDFCNICAYAIICKRRSNRLPQSALRKYNSHVNSSTIHPHFPEVVLLTEYQDCLSLMDCKKVLEMRYVELNKWKRQLLHGKDGVLLCTKPCILISKTSW